METRPRTILCQVGLTGSLRAVRFQVWWVSDALLHLYNKVYTPCRHALSRCGTLRQQRPPSSLDERAHSPHTVACYDAIGHNWPHNRSTTALFTPLALGKGIREALTTSLRTCSQASASGRTVYGPSVFTNWSLQFDRGCVNLCSPRSCFRPRSGHLLCAWPRFTSSGPSTRGYVVGIRPSG